ncbi:MAG: ribonuclease HI [Proteobacteria bacterium]|nr:ribonuclease HI [Pseudomonadota bacterium]
MKHVDMFTDGACSGNPGLGGWGVVLRYGRHEKDLSGGVSPSTTNNRMELQAVIEGLSSLKTRCHVTIHTDSKYVMDGVTKYLVSWKAKGWKTADRKEVKNIDLWQKLDELLPRHQIDWVWVKGHDGHIDNERADALARAGIPVKDNL